MRPDDRSADETQAGLSRDAACGAENDPGLLPPALAAHPRYRVLRLLGAGGMGAVYLARHDVMDRPVAVKVVRLADSSAGLGTRFEQEIKVAARLDHPNIVRAFDAETTGDLHLLVMEYVEGTDLAHLPGGDGPSLPVSRACDFARQAALGLQHAHEQGMVHRDIKPANLMLTAEGLVKILDFGLARFLRAEAPQGQGTATGIVMGTPDYMAPEQANDSHTADVRADVYSLGCTLYHLLAGRVPFPGGGFIDKLLRHATNAPEPLARLRSDLPDGLAAVVERMMAKRKEDRYQTPRDVARALAPFCPEVASGADGKAAGGESTGPYRARPVAGKRWRVGLAWLGAGALVVSALLFLMAILTRPGKTNEVPDLGTAPVAGRETATGPEILDFRTLHGATSGELEAWADGLEKPDFCPSFVSLQAGCSEPRFNAIAVRDAERIPCQYRLRMTFEAGIAYHHEQMNSGHRGVLGFSYREEDSVWVGHVWTERPGRWAGWGGDLALIKNAMLAAAKENLRPYSIAGPQMGTPGVWSVGFGPNDGRSWDVKFDLGPDEAARLFDAQRPRQWRPESLHAYWDGARVRFVAGLIQDQPATDWDYQFALTPDQLPPRLAEQKRLGFRPLSITSSGSLASPRYAVVWQRYRPSR